MQHHHRPMRSLAAGAVVGEWKLLQYHPRPPRRHPDGSKVVPMPKAKWLCRCSCGTEKLVIADKLQNGESKSCGHRFRAPEGVAPTVTAAMLRSNSVFNLGQ